MRVQDMPGWSPFALRDANGFTYEYVKLTTSFMEYLVKHHYIDPPNALTAYSFPVDVVQLRFMRWVVLDGTQVVFELRSTDTLLHGNAEAIKTLLKAERYFAEEIAHNQKAAIKQQNPPSGPNVAQVPKPSGIVKKVTVDTLVVPIECISTKCDCELFANTSVFREILTAARYGVRRRK